MKTRDRRNMEEEKVMRSNGECGEGTNPKIEGNDRT